MSHAPASSAVCTVCLEEEKEASAEQWVRLDCSHAFHEECIRLWLVTSSSTTRASDDDDDDEQAATPPGCPQCRIPVRLLKNGARVVFHFVPRPLSGSEEEEEDEDEDDDTESSLSDDTREDDDSNSDSDDSRPRARRRITRQRTLALPQDRRRRLPLQRQRGNESRSRENEMLPSSSSSSAAANGARVRPPPPSSVSERHLEWALLARNVLAIAATPVSSSSSSSSSSLPLNKSAHGQVTESIRALAAVASRLDSPTYITEKLGIVQRVVVHASSSSERDSQALRNKLRDSPFLQTWVSLFRASGGSDAGEYVRGVLLAQLLLIKHIFSMEQVRAARVNRALLTAASETNANNVHTRNSCRGLLEYFAKKFFGGQVAVTVTQQETQTMAIPMHETTTTPEFKRARRRARPPPPPTTR